MGTIISAKNKKFLVNSFNSYEDVLNKFNWTEKLQLNGKETGLTPQDLLCWCDKNKKKLRTKAAVLTALDRAVNPKSPLAGCGLGNDFSYLIEGQVKRIVAKLSNNIRPFEVAKSLYQEHANKRVVVRKDSYLLKKLVCMGVVEAIPEGTFFGNTPKEFNNYWVEVNSPGCWHLAHKLIEKEIKKYNYEYNI